MGIQFVGMPGIMAGAGNSVKARVILRFMARARLRKQNFKVALF